MLLSPFDSFQSRFVTYLLNFPRKFEMVVYDRLVGNVVYLVD